MKACLNQFCPLADDEYCLLWLDARRVGCSKVYNGERVMMDLVLVLVLLVVNCWTYSETVCIVGLLDTVTECLTL